MHKFPSDLYGSVLKVCILGYIRDEKAFESLGETLSNIHFNNC